MYSTGSMQTLHVSHPDLVKEISVCKSLDLGKPLYLQKDRGALLGKGILTSNGALWAHQRKVIATELFMDKVKVYPYQLSLIFCNCSIFGNFGQRYSMNWKIMLPSLIVENL